MVWIEIDGGGEAGDRLVPRLGLDRETSEEELCLGQTRLSLGEAEQHAARAVIRLLLHLEARQHQVRLFGVRAERDRALELGLGFPVLPLRAQELGERHACRRLVRSQLHGAPRRAHRLVHVVRSHEHLGKLRPERGRVRVTLDGAAHERDRLLEAARLDVHLGDGVGVVRIGAGVGGGRASRDLLVPGQRRPSGSGTAGQPGHDHDHGQPAPGLRQEASRRSRDRGVGNDASRFVDFALGPGVERRRGLNARAGRRLGLDASGDESERADDIEPLTEAPGQLLTTQRELVKPRRVVHGHGQAAVGKGPGLGSARRVGTDDLPPGPTNSMLQETVAKVGHRGQQQIGDGARRPNIHALVSYIYHASRTQGPAGAVGNPDIVA